ncbi:MULTISPECIES: ornithine--oxo-acid transaminase [Mammaliicoccus]|uniref:ornithine aminotransferase n=3 Tax=Mammaliicoccus fleurettii TaxID=150056 RepID=A0ABS5MPL9_9STAP|nr:MULTISPECIES: ornithine--oxo-acid transaminase [Mammaliicoccus]MBS3697868.1 ornithine--oxo-acid transaminase [Mammaliicoccus fleurettii]MEB6202367.1 ornithine--oxo-acid transaminase [Mammaliicoccus fleurettii]MEB7725367.1 ornithine--oxo-acid transaminase [Mammaliicoccus fleurettii]MEB7781141.1 ornithine--oxo-acid transaminase [Mammaliicoccus fleurettii]MEB7807294.1 ornithine--oxo-acid transaminase [Mammaliicoccus fleurettii]
MNQFIELTEKYSPNNYSPLNIVLTEGQGAHVKDSDGNTYIDCVSGFSVLNQGHSHPKIIQAFLDQSQKITMTSRALYSDNLGVWEEKICKLANKNKVLPMNTGTEAVETAIKVATKWGQDVKGINADDAEIIAMEGNFHGRTIGSLSLSSNESYKKGFGVLAGNIKYSEFGNIEQIESLITPQTTAIILEPIQGEGGVNIPPKNFIKDVKALCEQHNVLLIADEIQVGLGRTGKMFAMEWEEVEPDMYLLGKALGGGLYPISAVVANDDVMQVLTPGTHGSTFGGNPLACAVSIASLDVLIDESLPERSEQLGKKLLSGLQNIDSSIIKEVRGRGLFIGIELNENAQSIVSSINEQGVLCKETQGNIIRLAPPLVIEEDDINTIISVITQTIEEKAKQTN